MRMKMPDGQLITPFAFLSIAEAFGLVAEIDAMMVGKGLDLAARGRRVAVNLSAHSLTDPGLTERVEKAVQDGLDPRNLTFEVSENSAGTDLEAAKGLAVRLTQIGCDLAIDEFGVGFASLVFVKHLPAQMIKVGREFVGDLPRSLDDYHVMGCIVDLAAKLGRKTAAVGVEDGLTLEILKRLGVDYAQGFFIGRPRESTCRSRARSSLRLSPTEPAAESGGARPTSPLLRFAAEPPAASLPHAQKLLSRLPKPVVDRLRAGRKRYRRIRYRARERLRPVHLGRTEIETALSAAGIGEGDAKFVQAGMSSFGTIEGGPDAVIEAFRAVLGPDGLIAMPAFPLDRPALHYVREGPPFDLNNTPSRMGAISERFRTSEGVVRSLHPTHSVTAQGPGAAALVAGHEVAETPFGNDTPFTRLVERRGYQVYFGSGVGAITMYHAYECLREPPYPIEVFYPQRIDARCIDGEGNSSDRADPGPRSARAGRPNRLRAAARRSCGVTWSLTGCAR